LIIVIFVMPSGAAGFARLVVTWVARVLPWREFEMVSVRPAIVGRFEMRLVDGDGLLERRGKWVTRHVG
jgi:hypothetical protein